MGKLYGITSGVAVAFKSDDDPKLWIVYGLSELARIVSTDGPFNPQNRVELPNHGKLLTQRVIGKAAIALDSAIEAMFIANREGYDLSLRPFYGVASVALRSPGLTCVLLALYPRSGTAVFAVVYSVRQLQDLQRQYFPEHPEDVPAIQGVAHLPEESDYAALCVTEQLAAILIVGCNIGGILSIN